MQGKPIAGQSQATMEHISKGGLPVNPQLLKEVHEKLKGGAYKNNCEHLIADLKSDPGLFVHCAKNLKSLVDDLQVGLNPIDELRKLEQEKLESLLDISAKDISIHNFSSANDMQILRLQHSLLSSHTAETIAEKAHIPSDLAFSSSVFRQLGLNLIAWNYPRIYSKVLATHRSRGVNVEEEFDKRLKITPVQIGARFAAEWGMCPDLRRTLTSNPGIIDRKSSDSEDEKQVGLHEICELADLYARSRDPEHFPEDQSRWEEKQEEVKLIVDQNDLLRVETSVKSSILRHEELIPTITEVPLLEKEHKQRMLVENKHELLRANHHLQKCPDTLLVEFERVYNRIEEANISLQAIKQLVNQAVPAAGFVRGCLFLLNKESLELEPALRIGDIPLKEYRAVINDSRSGIASAIHCHAPVKKTSLGVEGTSIIQLTGSLANPEIPGVLYLELSDEDSGDPSHNTINYFHAIRQALNDCLESNTR